MMKINQIQPTVQIKQPIIKRIKTALIKPLANLKSLVSDVFEREKVPRYIVIDGKKIDERDLLISKSLSLDNAFPYSAFNL